MKKLLALFGALALIICVSSCSGGYDGKKVTEIVKKIDKERLSDSEIDVKDRDFLGKQYLYYLQHVGEDSLKLVKECKSKREFDKRIDGFVEEKYPCIDEVRYIVGDDGWKIEDYKGDIDLANKIKEAKHKQKEECSKTREKFIELYYDLP